MAKIEMDMTEYKAMEENKALLQEALKKEEKLNAEIKQLQKEKLEALEASKMKVTKISRTEIREEKLLLKHPRQILEDIARSLGLDGRGLYEALNRRHHDPAFGIPGRYIGMPMDEDRMIHYIIESCFKSATSTRPTQHEIIVEGLDEVKVELRKELEEELKKEIAEAKKNREVASEIADDNKKLKTENKALRTQKGNLEKEIEDLVGKIEHNEKLETNYASYKNALEQIDRLIQPTIWKFKEYVRSVKNIVSNAISEKTS